MIERHANLGSAWTHLQGFFPSLVLFLPPPAKARSCYRDPPASASSARYASYVMLTVATMLTSARPPAVRGDRTYLTHPSMDPMRSPFHLCCCTAFAAAGNRGERHPTVSGICLPCQTRTRAHHRLWPFSPMAVPVVVARLVESRQGSRSRKVCHLHAILFALSSGCIALLLAVTHTGYVLLSPFMFILHLTLF
jgi:hypothetical protein